MANPLSHNTLSERTRLAPGAGMIGLIVVAIGLACVVASLVIGIYSQGGLKRFFFAYLFAWCYFTAICVAGLIWTMVQHLVRAGWSTNVRRIMETIGMQVWVFGVLALPILANVLIYNNDTPAGENARIFAWARPVSSLVSHHEEGALHEGRHAEHAEVDTAGHTPEVAPAAASDAPAAATHDALTPAVAHDSEGAPAGPHYAAQTVGGDIPINGDPNDMRNDAQWREQKIEQLMPGSLRQYDEVMLQKRFWLNPWFFCLRIIIYFVVLTAVALYYYRSSTRQDRTQSIETSVRLGKASAPLVMACGLCLSFIGFDMFMTLDPHWFSTMFGVYYFAGGTQAMWATTILILMFLQARGYLTRSVTAEHYQDLGKWLFAFVFFWGYVTFSQYMLQWYANLPEETFWFQKRGATTAGGDTNAYTIWVLALLFCRFLIPFPFLLSRHVKRFKPTLMIAALWILGAHLIDMYLIVIPESSTAGYFGLPEIAAWVGFAGLFFGGIVWTLSRHELRAVGDPRVHESMAFQNM